MWSPRDRGRTKRVTTPSTPVSPVPLLCSFPRPTNYRPLLDRPRNGAVELASPCSGGSEESAPPRCDRSEVCVVLPRRYQRQGGDHLHEASLTTAVASMTPALYRMSASEFGSRDGGPVAAVVRASSRARAWSAGVAVAVALAGQLVDLPLGPARMLRPDDLPAAGPRRPARLADRLAVDRQDVDLVGPLLLFAVDRDVSCRRRRRAGWRRPTTSAGRPTACRPSRPTTSVKSPSSPDAARRCR